MADRGRPTPSGAHSSDLAAVSCPDAGSCVAVGVLNRHSGTDVPLVERWDGNTWSARTAPVPAGATTARLTGVSCPTTTACTAAGTFVDPHGDDRTLAETVHGTTWQVVATPNEPGAVATIFNAVSCRSAGFCDAVGYSYGLSSSGTRCRRSPSRQRRPPGTGRGRRCRRRAAPVAVCSVLSRAAPRPVPRPATCSRRPDARSVSR